MFNYLVMYLKIYMISNKLPVLKKETPKGQKISKQNCHAETSPKKTNKLICFSILKSS